MLVLLVYNFKLKLIKTKPLNKLVNPYLTTQYLFKYFDADKIEEHLNEERESAAVRIQSCWRGHVIRSLYDVTKINFRRKKAAIVIQKAVSFYEHVYYFNLIKYFLSRTTL